MSANNKQVGGEHYKRYAVEPWDFIIQNNLSYLCGNVVKYVVRADDKGGVQDIDKAIHYLEKMREQFAKVDVDPKVERRMQRTGSAEDRRPAQEEIEGC
jgi:hypothetical protein